MIQFTNMAEKLDLQVDDETVAACLYLESQGLEFMIDFGTSNAFDLAFAVMEFGKAEALSWHAWPYFTHRR